MAVEAWFEWNIAEKSNRISAVNICGQWTITARNSVSELLWIMRLSNQHEVFLLGNWKPAQLNYDIILRFYALSA